MIRSRWRTTTGRSTAGLLAASTLLLAGCTDEADPATASGSGTGVPSSTPAPTAPAPTGPASGSPAAGPAAADPSPAGGIAFTVTGGEVQGPGDRVEVPLGSEVRLTVTSDRADELHVHGYDRSVRLQPGVPATAEFPADIPGVFEVELHDSGLLLTSLQVQ